MTADPTTVRALLREIEQHARTIAQTVNPHRCTTLELEELRLLADKMNRIAR
jgi:hypothetical protein